MRGKWIERLISRWHTRQSSERCPALFYSEGHPLCWRWHLLSTELQRQTTLHTLLRLPLYFYWVSQPPDFAVSEYPIGRMPEHRSLTALTERTLSALITDLQDLYPDGYGREVLIMGIDIAYSKGMDLANEMQKFLKAENSFVRLAVLRLEDDPCDYIYIQYEDIVAQSEWLLALGISSEADLPRYPYSRLYTASLDVRLEGLSRLMELEQRNE